MPKLEASEVITEEIDTTPSIQSKNKDSKLTIHHSNNSHQLCSKIKANLGSTSNNIIEKIIYIENVLSDRSKMKGMTTYKGLKGEMEKSLSTLSISSLSEDFKHAINLPKKKEKSSQRKYEKCIKKIILIMLIVAFCAFLHLLLCDLIFS